MMFIIHLCELQYNPDCMYFIAVQWRYRKCLLFLESVPEWLSPQPFKARRIFANFSCARYIKNNMSTVVTTVLFTVINIGLFTYNAIAYKHSGPAVSIARGFGLCLDFDTVTVIVLMLRKTLTWLRGTSLGPYLPLDQHINLHKVVAYVILMLAIGHTTAHCVNISE